MFHTSENLCCVRVLSPTYGLEVFFLERLILEGRRRMKLWSPYRCSPVAFLHLRGETRACSSFFCCWLCSPVSCRFRHEALWMHANTSDCKSAAGTKK